MDVWVIQTGEYEQAYVFGVADSLDAAVEYVKAAHQEPYIVAWDEAKRRDDGTVEMCGHFEAVKGYSVRHKSHWSFERMPVQTL